VEIVKADHGYHVINAATLLWGSITKATLPQWLLAFGGAVVAWATPSTSLANIMGALMIFTLLDFVVGTRVSVKRGKFIRSKLLGKIVDKSLAYGCSFIIGVVLHKNWPQYPALAFLWDLAMSAFAARELTSILEKFAILGVPYCREIAKVLRIKTDDLVEDTLDKIKAGEEVKP
jgi:hypothetical protein